MLRQEKVAEAIKRVVSSVIHVELRDPRLGFITITKAKITPDMKYAYVFFSVLGKEEDYQKTKEALTSAKGFIKRIVGQNLKLRFVPDIIFKEDKESEYTQRIEEVLNEIKELDEPKKSTRRHKKK